MISLCRQLAIMYNNEDVAAKEETVDNKAVEIVASKNVRINDVAIKYSFKDFAKKITLFIVNGGPRSILAVNN